MQGTKLWNVKKQYFAFGAATLTRNSEERSPSLFVQALNEDAQAVFMGCPGWEFILCLSMY